MAGAAKNFFANRGPMYFGGLLLGLAAGVGFYKAKQAMMPKFHEIQETRDEVTIAPGGSVRFGYGGDDPGYFLIPGLPTGAILSVKKEDGTLSPIMRLGYGQLVDKDPALGPLAEEGRYNLDADFFICTEPGVADCTKLSLNQDIRVDRNAASGDAHVDINLPQLAQEGLKAGDMGNDRNRVSDKEIEKTRDGGQ